MHQKQIEEVIKFGKLCPFCKTTKEELQQELNKIPSAWSKKYRRKHKALKRAIKILS
jgi:hypothetical protein